MKPLYNPKLITNEFSVNDKIFIQQFHKLFIDTKTRIENKKFGTEQQEKPIFLPKLLELLGYVRGETYQIEVSAMGRSIDAAIQKKINNEIKNYIAIEWKGIDTKTLDSQKAGETPVSQMWDYMGKGETEIGLVSNFLEYRIYTLRTKQSKYQSYSLDELCDDSYKLNEFYYLLKSSNIIKKDKNRLSAIEELIEKDEKNQETITENFYRQFKAIRIEIFEHIKFNNSNIDPLTILEKTQKLLDRFIFTLFCEDRMLLPKNTVKKTYEYGLNDRDRHDTKIWKQFKFLFEDINFGRDDSNLKINGYNGGLFLKDEVLDSFIIRDKIWRPIVALGEYDFNSDLDVNILGHIFEQSIKDLEIIKFKILGIEVDENKSTDKKLKKKKEGVFYTPENLTEYIVQNTVGQWLEDNKDNPKALDDITIIDPAGGSGAFLNQVHTFLTIQHANRIKENISDVFTGSNMDKGIEFNLNKNILNNNLFMVDLQPESVEIAKLSLWLKTARVDEKLNNLDQNIKCGNSLVSDKIIGGELALDWNKEFPNIMKNGGFDIIVGNPPWVFARDQNFTDDLKKYYNSNFKISEFQLNTYVLFIEQAFKLLNKNGYLGFVLPNTWLTNGTFEQLRKFILENTSEIKVINILDKVFEDAGVDCSILIFKKSEPNLIEFGEMENKKITLYDKVPVIKVNKKNCIYNISEYKNQNNSDWLNKFEENTIPLKSVSKIKTGFEAYGLNRGIPAQTELMKGQRIYHSKEKLDDSWSKYLEGSDVKRYEIDWSNSYIQYGKNLAAPRILDLYIQKRILVRQIPSKPPFCINAAFTNEDKLFNDRNSMIILDFEYDEYFILGCLNSKVLSKWFILKFDKLQRGTFPQFKANELEIFPIPLVTEKIQKQVTNLVLSLINEKKTILKLQENVFKSIFYKIGLSEEISTKLLKLNSLCNLSEINFTLFNSELEKNKIYIELKKIKEIKEYYTSQQNVLNNILKNIESVDSQIENLVSSLYGVE
jgi:tRNA1(Val) A37 N6-methylase TrmN6